MRTLGAWTAAAALVGTLACGRRKSAAPDWVQTAPARTVLAVSGQTGWFLGQPVFQDMVSRFPLAEQTLDLFLRRARINPAQETGRITFYVLESAKAGGKPSPTDFLIQLGGFRDPGALQVSIAEAFPMEGSLILNGRDHPLFVVLDLNQVRLRVCSDGEGRIWLGDLAALGKLSGPPLARRDPVSAAAGWIQAGAPVQGFLRPRTLLADAGRNLPAEMAAALPRDIDAMAWSVAPGSNADPLYRFDLAFAGEPAGITQVQPWLQRLVAAASSLQAGTAGPPPEILQERRRIALRCQLTRAQLDLALAKLQQPGLRLQAPGS